MIATYHSQSRINDADSAEDQRYRSMECGKLLKENTLNFIWITRDHAKGSDDLSL